MEYDVDVREIQEAFKLKKGIKYTITHRKKWTLNIGKYVCFVYGTDWSMAWHVCNAMWNDIVISTLPVHILWVLGFGIGASRFYSCRWCSRYCFFLLFLFSFYFLFFFLLCSFFTVSLMISLYARIRDRCSPTMQT